MFHKLEFFRTAHYFYFYLSSLGIFIAVKAGYEFPVKSIFIVGAALANMYFSYYAEFRVRELLIVKRSYWFLSHLVIIALVIVHYLVLLSRNPFPAVLDSTLIITTYLGVLRSLVILMTKLNIFGVVLNVTGFSKEHIGMKKAIFLLKERAYIFEKLSKIVDLSILKSYKIGTSQKIDDMLRRVEDAQNMDIMSGNIKYLFIYLYEYELEMALDCAKKREIKKIICSLKKTVS